MARCFINCTLVGNILMAMPGYYLSQMTAIRRAGGDHYLRVKCAASASDSFRDS